ncbi:MAG: cytochrome c5 family protein, partial [Gammaproteobacteria bacterium]
MCHSTGMMNSPKLGNATDWAPRIEKGMDTLYSNAINGLNMMPARGGNPNLSDDEVKAAVDYMLSEAQ